MIYIVYIILAVLSLVISLVCLWYGAVVLHELRQLKREEKRKAESEEGQFSFCESSYAASLSPWHLRVLTAKGRKLGGGADTRSLCDREVHWDLSVPLTEHHLSQNTCTKCWVVYNQLRKN